MAKKAKTKTKKPKTKAKRAKKAAPKTKAKAKRRPPSKAKTRNAASRKKLAPRAKAAPGKAAPRGKSAAGKIPCLLITGFGPFPGAPFNPSGPLAESLARTRRFSARLVCHVFPTSYQAVDRDLPRLIAKHQPDAVVMFGLANRSRHVRIETLARNALSPHSDALGFTPARRTIASGRKPMSIRAPGAALLRAARSHNVPAKLSHDAGRYVCNYLYWRALEAAGETSGPKLAVFVHIPQVARNPLPLERARRRTVTLPALARSAEAILISALASLKANPR